MGPHGKCCGDSSHEHDDPEKGVQYSLYTKINLNDLECLNETVEGSGKTVFKPWEDRLNRATVSKPVKSKRSKTGLPDYGNFHQK